MLDLIEIVYYVGCGFSFVFFVFFVWLIHNRKEYSQGYFLSIGMAAMIFTAVSWFGLMFNIFVFFIAYVVGGLTHDEYEKYHKLIDKINLYKYIKGKLNV